jgi:twitching motility protein PilT
VALITAPQPLVAAPLPVQASPANVPLPTLAEAPQRAVADAPTIAVAADVAFQVAPIAGDVNSLLPADFNPAKVVNEFAAIMKTLSVEGVSDIHFDDVAWPVKYGRPTKSTIHVSDATLLAWAEVFGKARGGAEALAHGANGSLECMAVIGDPGAGLTRLRMTYRRQATGYGMTLRIVPEIPPRLSDAVFHNNPVPQALIDLTLNSPSGLILTCGPTGSGKTTLLAALLAEVNYTQNKHIYTAEDPIEFVHHSVMSIITQREMGDHADTFPNALKTALRSFPNIILVGELLDLGTVRVAIEAANKGHLVFATSHASSAQEAISSLVNQFPGSEQNQIATALAQALKAVVVQRLVPTTTGKRVPAREFLLNNVAISSKIRDQAFTMLTQALKPTEGMWTFEDDLARLWAQGQITEEAAMQASNDRRALKDKLIFASANIEEVSSGKNRVMPKD